MERTPRAVVEEVFDRMADDERRQTVGELFSEDAVVTFPGVRFEGPDAPAELLASLEPRYEWAAKEFDRWLETGDHVVSLGTLYGVDTDGDRFEDVRYADVYEVVNGEIVRMDVYNDLAAEGVVD
jgi:ketosteroid isomerase-like protein